MADFRQIPGFPGYDFSAAGVCRSYWKFKGRGQGQTPVWNLVTTPRVLSPDTSSRGSPRYKLRRGDNDYVKMYATALRSLVFPELKIP